MKIAAFLLCALAATPALADERWSVEQGDIFWESEFGDVAVFSMPYDHFQRRNLYIEGLPTNIENRGTFRAYWIAPGAGACTAALTGPDGMTSQAWGWATVTFDRRTFPSDFSVEMHDCAYPYEVETIRATSY